MAIEIVDLLTYPLKMVISHSYVSLPEGSIYDIWLKVKLFPRNIPNFSGTKWIGPISNQDFVWRYFIFGDLWGERDYFLVSLGIELTPYGDLFQPISLVQVTGL